MITTSLFLSLQVTGVAMLGVIILGTSLGWLLARYRLPGKSFLNLLLLLPLVLPPTVTGFYLVWLLKPQGLLGRLLPFSPMFHWTGAALAAGVVSLPLMLQSARAAFESIPEPLLEAANVLGQSPWQRFWRVALPLAFPSLVAGAMLSFARAMGEFGATLMLAGNIQGKTQTLPLAIYEALLAGQDQRAWQLVALLTCFSWLILYLSLRLNPRSTRI